VLLRIFNLEPTDPLLWKLSYTDTELTKLMESRYEDSGRVWRRSSSHKPPRKKLTLDTIWYTCVLYS